MDDQMHYKISDEELAKKITENDGQKTFEHYLTSNLYKDSMFLEAITKNEI